MITSDDVTVGDDADETFDPSKLFDDVPYAPPKFELMSDSKREGFNKYTERLRKSVTMLNNRELTPNQYVNERMIALYAKDYGEMVLSMTAYQALEKAEDCKHSNDKARYERLASCLEERTLYTARVF